MLNMTVKEFFRSCFSPLEDYLITFWNMKTGNVELVTRSGDIFLVIPRNNKLSEDEFREYVYFLLDSVMDMICESSDWFYSFYPAGFISSRFDYPRSAYPEFFYHPDDFKE